MLNIHKVLGSNPSGNIYVKYTHICTHIYTNSHITWTATQTQVHTEICTPYSDRQTVTQMPTHVHINTCTHKYTYTQTT